MSNIKFNWESIFNDSAEIMVLSISKGINIPSKVSELHEKLKEKYEAEGKITPPYDTYRQVLYKKLNTYHNQKTVKSALYQLAGAYDKMTLQMLAENITITTDEVADSSSWLFIRISAKGITAENRNKHLYYLADELKKKFNREIIFISFDIDTLVIMCADSNARKTIVSYFDKSVIHVTIISEQEN